MNGVFIVLNRSCYTPAARAAARTIAPRAPTRMTVAEELRMCGWGPYTREASVWEACCWYSGVINTS